MNATSNHKPFRILIVDDHVLFRDGLRALLSSVPDAELVGEATNGREAIEKAEQSLPDVIVLDFQMPEMNGLDAAREIRRRSPEIPILMVTLHMSPQLEHQAKRIGIRGACDKTDVGCVVDAVGTLLRHGTYYRSWH